MIPFTFHSDFRVVLALLFISLNLTATASAQRGGRTIRDTLAAQDSMASKARSDMTRAQIVDPLAVTGR